MYGGEACGYVVEFEHRLEMYRAGDTDVFGDMQIIRELCHPDIAMIPRVGDHSTVGPREAAVCSAICSGEHGDSRCSSELFRSWSAGGESGGWSRMWTYADGAGQTVSSTVGRAGEGLHAAEFEETTPRARNVARRCLRRRRTSPNSRPEWQHHGFVTEPRVDDYLYSLLPPRDAVLAEMEEQATKRRIPIVGPVVARVLHQLALIINAKSVFEMGSAIGYSTIWWARAVGGAGRVIYTDGDRKNADEARAYFERAGVSDQSPSGRETALELLSEQEQEFDIIFNDIDKEDCPRAFAQRCLTEEGRCSSRMTSYGAARWWRRHAGYGHQGDPGAKSGAVQLSPDVFTTILPVRDGLAVAERDSRSNLVVRWSVAVISGTTFMGPFVSQESSCAIRVARLWFPSRANRGPLYRGTFATFTARRRGFQYNFAHRAPGRGTTGVVIHMIPSAEADARACG